jgi:hypothetical protein
MSAAKIPELLALERAVEGIARYIENMISEIKITQEMKAKIDDTSERFTALIKQMVVLDKSYRYDRKIKVIEKLMKVIVGEKVKVPSNRINIIDETKKIYAVVEEMVDITEVDEYTDSYDVITRQLKQNTSDLYRLLTGDDIPAREKNFQMIQNITPFMEKLAGIYVGFGGDMSKEQFRYVCINHADEFIELYTINNKGVNKSIESKKVYIDAFEIALDGKDTDYKRKAMNIFMKPLLNTWITNILLALFHQKDVNRTIESRIQNLASEVLVEYRKDVHFLIRLNEIRENISLKYQELKKKTISDSNVTMEQFETMFVKHIDPDQGNGYLIFSRLLMCDTMELEAIEL